MNEHKFREYIYWGVTAVAVIVCCILVVMVFLRWNTVCAAAHTVNVILAPITYGAMLAYLLTPVYNAIRKATERLLKRMIKDQKERNKYTRTLATVGSLCFLGIVVIGLISMIIPQLWVSISGIINSIPAFAQTVSQWIEETFANNPEVESTVMGIYNQAMEKLISWTNSTADLIPNIERVVTGLYTGVINVIAWLKNVLIGVIVMLYLLNMKELLCAQAKKIVYGVFPVTVANNVIERFRFIHQVFGGFIIGKLIDSLIIGILTFMVMSFLQMPYTLLISVIIGVTNIIPFFGPFIGAIPSFIIIVLQNPVQGLYFLIFVIILQQVDGNIIGPKILGDSTGLSSFWVVFAILVFGGLWGFPGMLLGVPIMAVIYYIVSNVVTYSLKKRGIPETEIDYVNLERIDKHTNQPVYETTEKNKKQDEKSAGEA